MKSEIINIPIPSNISIEGWKDVKIEESNEPLVLLNNFSPDNIVVKSRYFEQLIIGSSQECYCRIGVARRLVRAAKYLPKGYKFLIWDAWRPIIVQQSLYDNYKSSVKSQFPELTEAEVILRTEQYVSIPSDNTYRPSPHLTGGAIDLTIIDEDGNDLDMGTEFDYFGIEASTNYYETLILNKKNCLNNRRLLYNILNKVGFTNYPDEWWHYDYGNQFWGKIKKKTATYGLISHIDVL